jgi:hypothetical protein
VAERLPIRKPDISNNVGSGKLFLAHFAVHSAWSAIWFVFHFQLAQRPRLARNLTVGFQSDLNISSIKTSTRAREMQIDLHGYHPRDIINSGVLRDIVRQAFDLHSWPRQELRDFSRFRQYQHGLFRTADSRGSSSRRITATVDLLYNSRSPTNG